MRDVDYVKLSEQYASFLVAVGGVSITALTLVLSIGHKLTMGESSPFLVLSLVVATVCCFIGAQMMAETAAFINYSKERLRVAEPQQEIPPAGVPLGEPLFLLASTNIFVAVVLVIFALMLLPASSGIPEAAQIKRISFVIFLTVVIGSLCWMFLAAFHRMPIKAAHERLSRKRSWRAVWTATVVGLLWFGILCLVHKYKSHLLLGCTFIPIVLITGGTLFYFAQTLKHSHTHPHRRLRIRHVVFFGSAITFTYACLVFAGIRAMFY